MLPTQMLNSVCVMQEGDKAKIPSGRTGLEHALSTTETRLARLRQLQPTFIKWEGLRDKHLPDLRKYISELQRTLEGQNAVAGELQDDFDRLEGQLQVL